MSPQRCAYFPQRNSRPTHVDLCLLDSDFTLPEADSMYKFDEPNLAESGNFSAVSPEDVLPLEAETGNWLGSDAFSGSELPGIKKAGFEPNEVASRAPVGNIVLGGVVSPATGQENMPSVVPRETSWIGAAAQSAVQTAINNPLETGGTALLALLALRFKAPIVEEMAQAAAGLGKTLARSGSGVPLIRATRGLAGETSAVADSTFVSPWARAAAKEAGVVVQETGGVVAKGGTVVSDAGTVVAKGGAAADDAVVVAKEVRPPSPPDALTDKVPDFSGLRFDRFAPRQLARDTTAIPIITVDAFKMGQPFTREAFKIVPKSSAEAQLYKSAKDATVRVWSKDGVGSGFFVDSNHIATANHVLNGRTGLVTVELATGKAVPARVVAREIGADWALLRVDEPLRIAKPFDFAPAREVKTGMHGYLLGHPHGTVEKVMTKGRISSMGVNPETSLATVSHTAESVTGMSGSPLLLENRKVLGILRSGPSTSGTAFAGEAVHVRHLRPALDYARKVQNPNGVDWHTFAEMSTNTKGIPKIAISGKREIGLI